MSLFGTGQALIAGSRTRYVDEFNSLSGRWVWLAGTGAVSGGALQAATTANWGNNRVINPELTVNDDNWQSVANAVHARVDSALDPGSASGGNDNWSLKTTNVDGGVGGYTTQPGGYEVIAGASYRFGCRVYQPVATGARMFVGGYTAEATQTAAWHAVSAGPVVPVSSVLYVRGGSGVGDIGYFDTLWAYIANAVAYLDSWPYANFRTTLDHISPAAPSVVPFGWRFRATDLLNYWELRVLPNTAGNDMQIIQVTAGVETVWAESDIDWTTAATDQIELTANGQDITTRHKKSGAADWTAGPSYASATQGQTNIMQGPMFYGTTVNRLSRVEVQAI